MPHKPFPNDESLVYKSECPLCAGSSLADLGTPVSHESTPLHYNRCKRCNLIFMNPRPDQEWYNHLYQTEFWEVKKEKKNFKGQIKHQVRKEALWAEKFITALKDLGFGEKQRPHVLEIGCAYGLIGKLVAGHFSGLAFGVEPNDAARSFAERVTGVQVFAENMDQVVATAKHDLFDLIIFSHVLENIVEPLAALQAARRLLKSDGLLLIDTPNNFVRRSWHIHHPYCFTRPSLQTLLNRAGFAVKMARSWSRPKYVVGPNYLTVVAHKEESPETPSFSAWDMGLRQAVGWLAYSVCQRGSLGRLNQALAGKAWTPGKDSQKEIDRILSAKSQDALQKNKGDMRP